MPVMDAGCGAMPASGGGSDGVVAAMTGADHVVQ